MIRLYCMPGAVGLILILLLSGVTMAHDACRWEVPNRAVFVAPDQPVTEGDRSTYSGTLRVFVTEIESRWDDSDDLPFHNAMLSLAINEIFSIDDDDTLTWVQIWDGHNYEYQTGLTFGDVTENNIKVIAAVYNQGGYNGYSDPPSGAQFIVNEVDACAGAVCGETGYNQVIGDFTHSVLVEDGSTTW